MGFFNKTTDSNVVKNIKVFSERITIVVILTVLASVIPDFTDFLNIVGSLGTMTLGFILPPLYYMKVFKNHLSRVIIALNIFMIVFGIGGGSFSIYESVRDLIDKMQK